ncbi:unnamed protein product [Brachionus calyciflorus]|uniref:Uncharacterized protein n=1 Tax=Brachionus calyciflorus TaxID=104777 RepID=A0A813M3G9_9BILA|nr:unnamed protein product [Brachionus calyciflorus]
MSLRPRMTDKSEDEWKKWLKKDLLTFPRIQPFLNEEKKYQKKLYLQLVDEYNVKKRLEQENIIKRLDRDMNLNRILIKDEKYLNIGRNKPKSNFFSPRITNRIYLDASKTAKNQLKNHSKSIDNFKIDFQDETPCPRHVRNSKRFDNREYYKLLVSSSDIDQIISQESTISLPAIGTKQEVLVENEFKAESFVLPQIDSINDNNLKNIQKESSNSLPPINKNNQIGILKPKYQLAGFDMKKI